MRKPARRSRFPGAIGDHIAAAEVLLQDDGLVPPPRHATVRPSAVRKDMDRPDDLPRRTPKRWTVEDAELALERRFAELPRGVTLTRRRYVEWPPGAHGAPVASALDRLGGFKLLRDRVAKRLGR